MMEVGDRGFQHLPRDLANVKALKKKKKKKKKTSKRKVKGMPQSQTAALPRHQEEKETDIQTSTNRTNVRKALRLVLSSPSEATMFDRYYCIKLENICYISRYFLHYFVSLFHRCLANAISTDYARSRAGSTYLVTAANLWPWYDHNESCQ